MSKLVVAQCGNSKIWKKHPSMGAVRAKDAYVSAYFITQQNYAERSGHDWMILSAKYGFLWPDDMINDYNVTFKKKSDPSISYTELKEQVRKMNLNSFDEIIVLGGEDYRNAIKAAFSETKVKISDEFEGLNLFERMAAYSNSKTISPYRGNNFGKSDEGGGRPHPPPMVPEGGRNMTSTDDIRKYVIENLIEPAKNHGSKEITIRAGDIHAALGLKSRMPMVCSALESKMENMANVEITKIIAPPSGRGANFYVTYKL